MIEVQLSKQSLEKLIVSFDGTVLRYYSVLDVRSSTSGSGRIHVGHIKSIELTQNKKGKQVLRVVSHFDAKFSQDEVDEAAIPKVLALVAEVQRAMQTVSL
jgi:hypothetical protein